MNISGTTKVCAIIGDPVEHSLSPSIQNAAFQHLDLDYVYVAFTVRKENLENAILGARILNLHGLNITMPHKIDVIRYLDQLDVTARDVKSVNTILNKDGRLIGYSTDGAGALNALRYNKVSPIDKKIVILGAGGASRAVSFTLVRSAKGLVIINRTLERAQNLVNDLYKFVGNSANIKARRLDEDSLAEELKEADVLINATPLGMHTREMETPVHSRFLHSSMVVFDMVYGFSPETRLLKEAREVGAKTVDGIAMLIHSAAASFEIFTGKSAPIEVMKEAAMEELKDHAITMREPKR